MTADAELQERLARLEARAEIRDCIERYARGMDRRDRAILRSAYHDGAVDDHVGFVGEVDDFIDWAFAYHSTQTRYQHYLLNHTADIDGDEAHAETYYLFVGTDKEPANHMTLSGGRYVDRLERRDGRWAIVDRVCVVEWNAESTSFITDEVIAMMAGTMKVATHDTSDPSYDRPLAAARPATQA
ncbi:hypothetical protein MycrhN_5836 [Mycolicibacterium rhodesiae NBB3]|jgi:hypothetical protein|uniref:SnoaL-like domain-containing protein n=1 Tax=Mycolicibacterium rhodesiae (strain NBB3) TaxID=710685 RepID=G8RP72_MYCRN|nr:nuclear transport factor 2 family protein [Mycolicibacterium rhodesiae]AEV76301.1 hypothetical protein MycrhN_5836 [Mycolicibacterium rhodesiae NBB3]